MKKLSKLLSLALITCMLLSLAGAFPVSAAPVKLFELDLSNFSMSSDSSSSSGLTSSVANSTTQIEAYGSSNLTLSKQQFRNTTGAKTPYLNKAVSATTWAQVSGRLALADTTWAQTDVSYEFWADVRETRWRNVAAIEMLWTTADNTAGEKQLTLDIDGANQKWIASGGEYFSAPNGWHHVVITKSSVVTAGEDSTHSFTFYVDGEKRAEPATIAIPVGATLDAMRLLFGQSRTTKIDSTTQHWLPQDASYGGISVYQGVLTEAEIEDIYWAEKQDYTAGAPTLLFDMDLTNFDPAATTTARGIANSVAETGSTTNIELMEGVRTGTTVKTGYFEKGSYRNTLGSEIPYVSLKAQQYSSSSAATNARVWIDNADWHGKSFTAEVWLKSVYNQPYPSFFSVYDGQSAEERTNSLTDSMRIGIFNNASLWWMGSDANRKTLTTTSEDWNHITITRTVSEGTVTHEGYINGVKQFSVNDYTTKTAATEGLAGLVLGSLNSTCWYVSKEVDVADVKIYDDVLSTGEIAAHYAAEQAAYTPAELSLYFTDDAGEEVSSLDKLTSVNVSYRASNDDTIWVFGACYGKDGRLLSAAKGEMAGTGSLPLAIADNTATIKAFALGKDTLSPLLEAAALSYSADYNPSSIAATAAFYNDSDEAVRYMEGQSGLYAKAELVSVLPPENVSAKLQLIRNTAEVFSQTVPVSFTNRTAEVTVPLTDATPAAGDQLIFTVFDSERTYITKKISYEDLSTIVDVLLVAGQSNALGQGGNASESIKPESGTVYYNSMSNPLGGNQGWDSALGKTWHEETGHTVLIVKATWGGTGFPTEPNFDTGVPSTSGSDTYGWWNPGNEGSKTTAPYDCYTLAKERYAAAVASIDTNKYKIGRCVYFWNQGENENNSYTAAMYEEAFLELHNAFKTEFGTADTRLTHGGILPVRSSYSKGFPNLKLTGPRMAQYNMAKKYDDLFIVSDATEHWYSDAAIKAWFAEEYDGITYPLSKIPTVWADIMNTDNVHYKQAAMNEFGKQAAKSMLAYLEGVDTPDGIDLITPDGIQHYKNGDSITLTEDGAIPVIPVSVGTKAAFAVTGDAAMIDENGVLKPGEALLNDYATLTVTPERGSAMTFRVYSPLTDDSISIAAIKDNKAAMYSLTTDDNYAYTNNWIDDKLSEHGMVATMGLVTDWMETSGKLTWEEAQNLVATGRWGVASHTKAHKQSTFASLTEAELDEEINGARDILLEKFPGQKLLAMYTPGGITSALIRSKVKENHHILRGAGGGNNSLPITENGLLTLKSQAVYDDTTAVTMNGWIDTAIQNGEWVVEMWHGVGDTDGASWGGNANADAAAAHLAYVAQQKDDGKLWVTTLDEAAVYMTQRLKARLSVISQTENELVFTLTDELDDAVYDAALTVNITIPAGYTSAVVTQNGAAVPCTVQNGTAGITIKPDGGNITVTFSE